MKLNIMAEVNDIRNGIEARAPDLRLAAYGMNQEDALQSLKRGIIAWCEGLQSLDKLEKALKGKRLHWEVDGKEIEVELHV
jgi:hypothetical protein